MSILVSTTDLITKRKNMLCDLLSACSIAEVTLTPMYNKTNETGFMLSADAAQLQLAHMIVGKLAQIYPDAKPTAGKYVKNNGEVCEFDNELWLVRNIQAYILDTNVESLYLAMHADPTCDQEYIVELTYTYKLSMPKPD